MKSKSLYDDIIHSIMDYFTFSRIHRRGSLFLLILILTLCCGFYIIPFFQPQRPFDSSTFEQEIMEFEAALNKARLESKKETVHKNKYPEKPNDTESKEISCDFFNPNTISEEALMQFGLSGKQAQVITRYRFKGGKFRKKEDFKKMYCISAKEYDRLEPFIVIPADTFENKSNKKDSAIMVEKNVPLPVYDLNTVNQADLDSIKGIGPAIASSIVRYREKLGGFISVEQLYEVYGIDSLLFDKIIKQIKLESSAINKININKGFENDLKHPYLDRNLAKLIVNYRKLHGPFKAVDDLKKLALVNAELYGKLAPYLSTE